MCLEVCSHGEAISHFGWSGGVAKSVPSGRKNIDDLAPDPPLGCPPRGVWSQIVDIVEIAGWGRQQGRQTKGSSRRARSRRALLTTPREYVFSFRETTENSKLRLVGAYTRSGRTRPGPQRRLNITVCTPPDCASPEAWAKWAAWRHTPMQPHAEHRRANDRRGRPQRRQRRP